MICSLNVLCINWPSANILFNVVVTWPRPSYCCSTNINQSPRAAVDRPSGRRMRDIVLERLPRKALRDTLCARAYTACCTIAHLFSFLLCLNGLSLLERPRPHTSVCVLSSPFLYCRALHYHGCEAGRSVYFVGRLEGRPQS